MKKTLIRIINVLYRRSQTYLSMALAKHNLTSAEYPFIIAILKNDGLTQDELSSIICVDKSAAARTIKSLEEKGYVRREQGKLDKRQNRVYITEPAKELWPAVQAELRRFNELLTQNIDAADLEMVYSGLLQMEGNVISLTNTKEVKQKGTDDYGSNK